MTAVLLHLKVVQRMHLVFGPMNVPGTFYSTMYTIMSTEIYRFAFVYLNGILSLLLENFIDRIELARQLLAVLADADVTLKRKKN